MIRIRQIKVDIRNDSDEVLKKKATEKLKINPKDLKELIIEKKSIDARNKKNILFNYEVLVKVSNEDKILKKVKSNDIIKAELSSYKEPKKGEQELINRPVVVGSGPCGLFCALMLAENGYKPIIIERGEQVEERVKSVEQFWKDNVLNVNSNVCFGEGGAGTFSDGKLNTLVNDKECRIKKVFDTFVECGAPSEIKYLNKPHIGTNILRRVVIN
jgi:uncharacterized FAD-dependent dehydrogenase